MKNIFFIALSSTFFFVIGCSSTGIISIQPDYTGIEYTNVASSILEDTIYGITGIEKGMSLIDKKTLQENLFAADCMVSTIETPSVANLEIDLKCPKTNFSLFTRTDNSLCLTISQETMTEVIGFLPEDTKDYIDLLMAPLFTGEELTSEEYVDVIRGIYGPSVAANLLTSTINLSFIAEKNITNIKLYPEGLGTIAKQGNKVSFQIPLHKILSNSKKTEICIHW
jgi:hypothetical protein